MRKAKSRLDQRRQERLAATADNQPVIKRYLQYFPLLIISLLLYGGLFWLITNVYPTEVADFIFPNSYLPFNLLLFVANWFFLSYILLNSRRGLILSCIISLLVFLKLQRVLIEWRWLGSLLIAAAVLELLISKASQLFRQN